MRKDTDITDVGDGIDPKTGNFVTRNTDPVAENSEYNDALLPVESLGFVDDPLILAKTMARTMHSQSWVRGKFEYDEIFHETVVAMYTTATQDPPPSDKSEFTKAVFNQVGRFTGKVNWASKRETFFTEMEQEGDSREIDFPDRAKETPNVENNESELSEEKIDEIRQILKKSEQRTGQADRDSDVLVRFLNGESLDHIQTQCDWLKSKSSVEAAIARIITVLREYFGTDTATPIELEPEGRLWKKERPRNAISKVEYFRDWYDKNREQKKAKMREYMRAKRAREKDNNLTEPTDDL